MGQEAEHSCEQIATQAASSVDKICEVLGGIDSANNPHQFMKLVALGGRGHPTMLLLGRAVCMSSVICGD